MSDFEFIPTEKQLTESNIFKFMQKLNISSLDELSKKAKDDPEWFWRAVEKDVELFGICHTLLQKMILKELQNQNGL